MDVIGRACAGLLYRHRRVGKRALAFSMKLLPGSPSRRLAGIAERIAFWAVPEYQGDTLPPIFHYWSCRYVSPILARLGCRSPEDLYFQTIRDYAIAHAGPVSIASFGAGAASLELELLSRLRSHGLDVRFTCIDLNRQLKARALAAAAAMELGDRFEFQVADCDCMDHAGTYDILIVNQFLHHVRNIEKFCAMLKRSLAPQGVLLTCDVVGRNGHLPWPSVHSKVQMHWRSLKPERRFDRHFGAQRNDYVPVDHAAYSNEGVRAQDVVAGLSREFVFETFFTYGAAVMPFVERRIGFNFDPANPDDCAFIDQIASDDAEAITAARYPASNMVAVLRHPGQPLAERHFPVSPQTHIRLTQAELGAIGA
jgi:SAM-dependent methyltransferase